MGFGSSRQKLTGMKTKLSLHTEKTYFKAGVYYLSIKITNGFLLKTVSTEKKQKS